MNQGLNRKQSVVFFSDIVGYTRLMGKDEDRAFELMKENLTLHQDAFSKFGGQIVKELGDGILGFFDTSEHALSASLEIQKACIAKGSYKLRVGLHSGDIIFDHGDIFGDAVNLSSRIQSVGIPSSILISSKVNEQIESNSPFKTHDLGNFELKNVDHKVELFAVINSPLPTPKRNEILANIRFQERNPWLKKVLISLLIVLVGLLTFSYLKNPKVWEKEKSIAILPFTIRDQMDTIDYLSPGITEDLILQLSKIKSLKTIPYSTVSKLNPSTVNLDSLVDKLKVSAILRGNVNKLVNGLEIKIQLIDPEKKEVIWNEKFVKEGEFVPQIQAEIAKAIADKFNAPLTFSESSQIGKGESTNLEAFDLRLKAQKEYYTYERDNLPKAIEYLEKAIRLDPNYALAYVNLASCYRKGNNFEKALEYANKSLGLEENLGEGLAEKGAIFYQEGKIKTSLSFFEDAYELNSNNSSLIGNLGTLYFYTGDLSKALDFQYKSILANPNNYIPYQVIGWIYRILGDYSHAYSWLDASLKKNVTNETYEILGITYLKEGKKENVLSIIQELIELDSINSTSKSVGFLYHYLGMPNEAILAYEKAVQKDTALLGNKFESVAINLGYSYKKAGNHSLGDSLLTKALEVRNTSIIQEDPSIYLDLALIYSVKQQKKEMLENLEKSLQNGLRDLVYIQNNPIFSGYLKDRDLNNLLARYQKILTQTKITHPPLPTN